MPDVTRRHHCQQKVRVRHGLFVPDRERGVVSADGLNPPAKDSPEHLAVSKSEEERQS